MANSPIYDLSCVDFGHGVPMYNNIMFYFHALHILEFKKIIPEDLF